MKEGITETTTIAEYMLDGYSDQSVNVMTDIDFYDKCYPEAEVLKAMEEYAEEIALRFAKWMHFEGWALFTKSMWIKESNKTIVTSLELYALFNESKDKDFRAE